MSKVTFLQLGAFIVKVAVSSREFLNGSDIITYEQPIIIRYYDLPEEPPMSQQPLDPDQLHHLLCGLTKDLSEFQRLFTSILHKFQKIVTILYFQQSQIQCLEAKKIDLADKISELECQVDPYSQDGDAICNSRFIE